MSAIELHDLTRIYTTSMGIFTGKKKEILAVDGVSFQVGSGELFGLLGPNGAGKTTTVKMLTTMLTPTSGKAVIGGYDTVKDAREVQKRIGFIFGGERGLYWRLTGLDNLKYFASLYHVDPAVVKKRIPYLLELVGLNGREKEKVEGYSRGMKQRLHVARTLIHDPPILFLDEPTIGLDPVGARDFRNVIRTLNEEGKTIMLTTHYMYEADILSKRIAVINHGKIIALDSPQGLKEVAKDLSVVDIELFGAPESITEDIKRLDDVDTVSLTERDQRQSLIIQTPRGPEAVNEILRVLSGFRVGRVNVREPTLEDAYVRLVGGER
jgi:ABC-2 type transport system ATP-binding protein